MGISRKEKVVVFGDREMKIQELTISQIFTNAEMLMNAQGSFQSGVNIQAIHGMLLKVGPMFTDWKGEDFLALSPSQIKVFINEFKEINSDFLETLDSLGFLQKLKEIKQAIRESLENNGKAKLKNENVLELRLGEGMPEGL